MQNSIVVRRFVHFAHLCFGLLAVLLLASCATLNGPRDIEIPLSHLQQGLEKRFPVNQRVLEMFDIQLTHPQVSLQAEQNRITVTLDTSVGTPLTAQPWKGSLVLSGRLVLDTTRNAIVLNETRIDRLAADGMDETRQRLLGRIGNLVVDRIIQDVVLYSLKPEDLRYFGVQYAPLALRTTADALLITVAPAK